MEIKLYPDAVLRTKCEPVGPEEDVRELAEAMIEKMKELKGLGLAANQVGVRKSLFVCVMDGRTYVVINPRITHRSQILSVAIEGCFSFPNKRIRTRRPAVITAEFENLDRKPDGLLLRDQAAGVFQHEYDHLQGKTMLDREFMGRA